MGVHVLPVAGVICFLLALIFEAEAFTTSSVGHTILLVSVPAVGAMITTLTVSELSLVHRTSAVALQVLATLHQIPIVAISAAVFHDDVNPLSISGFACCIMAAFVYVAARRADKRLEKQQLRQESITSPAEGL